MGPARRPIRPPVPQSFQTRLTFAFALVVALTLVLVAPIMVNRIDDYVRAQEEVSLRARATATAAIIDRFIEARIGDAPVLALVDGRPELNPAVEAALVGGRILELTAENVALADVAVRFGPARLEPDGVLVVEPDPGLGFDVPLEALPETGQRRDPAIQPARADVTHAHRTLDWGMSVTLANPYTTRATTIAALTSALVVLATVAFLLASGVAAFIARRFTAPLIRLTDASRRLAEGDLGSRVPPDEVAAGTLELRALSTQFNAMADRLEESVAIIRHDRDASRDLLADVSHELRTPLAAMRTFVELLRGPAGTDPEARAEFLASSAGQLDRLDWLAQNLLELSKLDSGLVLLDLRPDDLRGTVEAAAEQHAAGAERRGIRLAVELPDRPLRVQHDAPRMGQVVGNLVGNALKFTARGGEVRVRAAATAVGARVEVEDTGAGIPPEDLPRIFDRFYRGSRASEARSAGSGLGLAIVKSIVDMHHGTIEVTSRVGAGSRFVVLLPRDPREARDGGAASAGAVPAPGASAADPIVAASSPAVRPPLNRDAASSVPTTQPRAADAADPEDERPTTP